MEGLEPMLNIRTKHCLICDNILYQNDIVETNAFAADHFALSLCFLIAQRIDDSDIVLNQLGPNDCITFSSADLSRLSYKKLSYIRRCFA